MTSLHRNLIAGEYRRPRKDGTTTLWRGPDKLKIEVNINELQNGQESPELPLKSTEPLAYQSFDIHQISDLFS